MLAVTPAHHVSATTQAFRQQVLTQREQRSLALASALSASASRGIASSAASRSSCPNDVWLTSLSANRPARSRAGDRRRPPSALPATATELNFQGYTYSQESVARLLERLSVVPDFEDVQLQSSTTASVSGQNVVNFTIVANIRNGKGAS